MEDLFKFLQSVEDWIDGQVCVEATLWLEGHCVNKHQPRGHAKQTQLSSEVLVLSRWVVELRLLSACATSVWKWGWLLTDVSSTLRPSASTGPEFFCFSCFAILQEKIRLSGMSR